MVGDAIEFIGTVSKVQTLSDGGLRFTFDAPESAILQAAELMTCKRFGQVLKVVCTAQSGDERADNGTDDHRKIHI